MRLGWRLSRRRRPYGLSSSLTEHSGVLLSDLRIYNLGSSNLWPNDWRPKRFKLSPRIQSGAVCQGQQITPAALRPVPSGSTSWIRRDMYASHPSTIWGKPSRGKSRTSLSGSSHPPRRGLYCDSSQRSGLHMHGLLGPQMYRSSSPSSVSLPAWSLGVLSS